MPHSLATFTVVLTHDLGPLNQENYPADFLSVSYGVSAGQQVWKQGGSIFWPPFPFSHLLD